LHTYFSLHFCLSVLATAAGEAFWFFEKRSPPLKRLAIKGGKDSVFECQNPFRTAFFNQLIMASAYI